jgi:hypothetical protein
MRNGSGDDLFIAFGQNGVFLKGFAHESPMAPHAAGRDGELWDGMYDGLPETLFEFRDEPAFSRDSATYCLWWDAAHPGWQRGVSSFAPGQDPDGSEEQLAMYDGDPETYLRFALDYFEVSPSLEVVHAIYRHARIDEEMISILNPDVDVEAVLCEIEAMAYRRL